MDHSLSSNQVPLLQPSDQSYLFSVQTFFGTTIGKVLTKEDAVIIIKCCQQGILPLIHEKPAKSQLMNIDSGWVFVFTDALSIGRWKDTITWSPSRKKSGMFTYFEVTHHFLPLERVEENGRKFNLYSVQIQEHINQLTEAGPSDNMVHFEGFSHPYKIECAKGVYFLKRNGLIKSTCSYKIDSIQYYLISYLRSHDFVTNRYLRPQQTYLANMI